MKKEDKKQEKQTRQAVLDAKTKLAKAKQAVMHAEKKVKQYLKNNPKKALAMAAGVGAVLTSVALALRQKKKHSKKRK